MAEIFVESFAADCSLSDEEDTLASELKRNCDDNKNETDLSKSATIFHRLATIYRKRKPKDIRDRMVGLIKSSALYNAAIIRAENVQELKDDLQDFCSEVLLEAGAECTDADLIKQAEAAAELIKKMRESVEQKLAKILPLPEGRVPAKILTLHQLSITSDLEELQKSITKDYTGIMASIAKFVEGVMGKAPCEFSLAGMGSLARKEITPYSDFENMILMESSSVGNYENMLNYFRWFSVIFQVVLINLGETIIPSISISSLNDQNSKHGDWFYDKITSRGICFDGMMPHACKFPLGRTHLIEDKPWKTELIKPVNEMLKYLNSEESLKNGYHLSTILTKTCHVYGNEKVFKEFEKGVHDLIKLELEENIQESVKKQISEDLGKFATRQSLINLNPTKQFNVKQVVYRSTTILVAEMGRYYKVSANSCFDILRELAVRQLITKSTKQKLMFAIALACHIRLKWYSIKKRQHDNIDSIGTFLSLIGENAAVTYFQIAYALQCDLSKRLNLKKFHLYSNPKLLNVRLAHFFGNPNHILDLSLDTMQLEISSKRYFHFDECLAYMEKNFSSKHGPDQATSAHEAQSNTSAKALEAMGKFFEDLNCFDDALECYENSLELIDCQCLFVRPLITENLCESSIKSLRNIAEVKAKIGGCLIHLRRYKSAKMNFEKSLQINKELSRSVISDRAVANSMHELGSCLIFVGKLDDALNYLQKSLLIKENISKNTSTDLSIASTSHEIGRCLLNSGQLSDSLEYLQRALKVKETQSSDPKLDRSVAATLRVIGGCYKAMGKLKKAKLYFEKTLDIFDRTSRNISTDRELADGRFWVGRCFEEMNEPEKAKELFEIVLLTMEKLSLDVAVDSAIATTAFWIGRCLEKMGKQEDAVKLFEKALSIEKRSSPDLTTDRNVANTCYWLGCCLLEIKKPEKAKLEFERALLIEKQLSVDVTTDRDVASTNSWIGRCLIDLKRPEEAKEYFDKTVRIYEKSSIDSTTFRDVASASYFISRCLIDMKMPEEAEVYEKYSKTVIECFT